MSLVKLHHRGVRFPLSLGLLALSAFALFPSVSIADPSVTDMVALPGHIPAVVSQSRPIGQLSASRVLSLSLTLPLRNQDELTDLLHRLSDKNDPMYGHYLTPDEFADRFSPTLEDYAQVISYAQSMGMTIINTHANRTVLDVTTTEGQVERIFGLHLLTYQSTRDGRTFYAPDREPQVPWQVSGVLSGVVGLNNAAHWHPVSRLHSVPVAKTFFLGGPESPMGGSGPGGGLAPSDIKTAYNLNSVSQTGSGQTLGLFELDGYRTTDITAYESFFSLSATTLQNVLVDGVSGAAGNDSDEVTLDIELQAALAPGASKILVYEGPNTAAGVIDTYNQIATDNLAKEISTSWGDAEANIDSSIRSSENTAFQQMASQGQSIFAAAGDDGAYDDGSSLSVDDPSSQPYMVGVGGTSLTTNGAGGTRKSETTWNNGSANAGAGGGGISAIWSIPSYQSGIISAASDGSTTMRNVPDVSLDADPNNGYAIYYRGSWNVFGGTSCAAPLWSAYIALVNQSRVSGGSSLLGFANPPLYAAAQSSYAADFFDIADGSTNLFYPAVTGYDDATGLGTFNGANLLATLSSSTTQGNVTLPTAHNDACSIKYNTARTNAAPGVLSNDNNGGSSTLTAALVTGTTHGNITLNSDGSFTYTPNTGYVGTDTFTYQAVNSVGKSNTATVTLTVVAIVPNAHNDACSIKYNTARTNAAPGVLGNDDNGGSSPMTAALVTGTTHGSITLNSDGSFTYTPNTGYAGTDSFTYQAVNSVGKSNVATVTLTVVATTPTAHNDGCTIAHNTTRTNAAPGVLSNDDSGGSSPLTAALVSNVTHGTLTLNSDGSFSYTPNTGFSGTDTFTYRVSNPIGQGTMATVTLTVQ